MVYLKGPTPASFCLFSSFATTILQKNFRHKQDSKSCLLNRGPHLHENPLRRGLLKVFPNLEMASILLSMKRWFCKCSRGGFCKIWCPRQGQVIVCQFRLGQLSNIFRKLHCKSGQVGSNLLNSVNRGFSNTCVLCCKEQGISRIKMKAMQAITSNFLLEQKENLLQSNNKF